MSGLHKGVDSGIPEDDNLVLLCKVALLLHVDTFNVHTYNNNQL
jgi:hypothetical protein